MRLLHIPIGAIALCTAAAAHGQLRPLIDPPASAQAATAGIDLYLLNEGTAPVPAQGPAEIETVARDGARLRLVAAAEEGAETVAPGAFVKRHYRLAAVTTTSPVALAEPRPYAPGPDPAPPAPAVPGETTTLGSAGSAAGFLDRFGAHDPVYGVLGAGDAGAKLQFSFAFRALGQEDGPHLVFAYTQAMFWAVDRPSAPFRATNYSPQLYVDLPIGDSAVLGAGYAHDSNGLGIADSVDLNRIFVRGTKRFALGRGWQLAVTPMAWFYVGDQGSVTDIERYWGYTALSASIGRQDGLKLAVTARGNVDSGRGAAEAFLSYPLARLSRTLPHIYVFGQGFTGYGEALSDYARRGTRARIGIAFTR